MSHQRTIIRNAIMAALSGATDAGTRVSPSRLEPVATAEIPCISVFTDQESVTPDSHLSAPRELTRMMDLAIVGWVRLNGNVDDALDTLSLQIEKAMNADPCFGGACSDSWLASTILDSDTTGSRPTGAIKLNYTLRYYTYSPEDADVTLSNFSTADIKVNLQNTQDPRNEAENTLTGLDT